MRGTLLPPALCASCGHDAPRDASLCGACGQALLPWRAVTKQESTDLLGFFFVLLGVVIAIAIARALALGSWAGLIGGLACVGVLAIIGRVLWLAQSDWEADGGATAATAFGRLTQATGYGAAVIEHAAPGQTTVRADVLLGNDKTRHGFWPTIFGANPLEIALAAAFVGALARGRIAITEHHRYRWTRTGPARRVVPEPAYSALSISLCTPLPAGEDAIAEYMLGPLYPAPATDYRGTKATPPHDGPLPPEQRPALPLLTIVRRAFPANQKPGRTLRRVIPRAQLAATPGEREALQALLSGVAKDQRARVWIALRDALRQAFAQRARSES